MSKEKCYSEEIDAKTSSETVNLFSPYWSHPIPTFDILCSNIFPNLRYGEEKIRVCSTHHREAYIFAIDLLQMRQ